MNQNERIKMVDKNQIRINVPYDEFIKNLHSTRWCEYMNNNKKLSPSDIKDMAFVTETEDELKHLYENHINELYKKYRECMIFLHTVLKTEYIY